MSARRWFFVFLIALYFMIAWYHDARQGVQELAHDLGVTSR